jgi:hypothetical protein
MDKRFGLLVRPTAIGTEIAQFWVMGAVPSSNLAGGPVEQAGLSLSVSGHLLPKGGQ